MKKNQRLTQALAQMQRQDSIYQPTAFWATASKRIIDELQTNGVEKFRQLPSTLNYFVPNYGIPTSGLNREQMEIMSEILNQKFPTAIKAHLAFNHWVSGQQSALAEYRTLLASENDHSLPNLSTFSESNVGHPQEQWEWNSQRFSRSSLNYLLGLSFLKKYLHGDVPRKLLEIGGGFGTLGEIWSQAGISDWQYIDIDIPPTQFCADYYLREVLGSNKFTGFDEIPINPAFHIVELWSILIFE